MSKLKLSDREISLIKGLLNHKNLNDQEVLSIFSYLHRNINHREVSAIRRGAKARYQQIQAASVVEVNQLLYDYAKVETAAAKLGFCELDEHEAQAHKSVEIMRTAITAYNSALLISRSEVFIVLAVIAWTYALHAELRRNDIEPVYVDDVGEPLLLGGNPSYGT